MPSKEDCDICGDALNKSTRKKIVCPFDSCKKYSCSKCFNHYLIDCGVTPTCMWCRKDFSLDFIYENTTRKFYDDYMNSRTNVLIDRAKSELPLLQERADAIMRKKRYDRLISSYQENFNKISNDIYKVKYKLSELYLLYGITKLSPFMKKINRFISNSWESWIESTTNCNLCDGHISKPRMTKTCVSCNLRTCDSCFKFCLLVNELNCISCNSVMFDKREDIKSVTTTSFYNKFFKKKPKKKTIIMKEIDKSVTDCVKEKIEINNLYGEYALDLYKTKNGIEQVKNNTGKKKEQEIKFVKKCPNENCRGFLSTAWKCGLCDIYYCHDCHKPKNERNDDEHVCDEKEKATIDMLKKESKPCPKCGMPIERISGCAQVWTPCCKIAFNWNTGKIDPGRIHSPEYYAYLRRTQGEVPREREDMPCGGIIDYYDIRPLILTNIGEKNKIETYYQKMTHINGVDLPILPHNIGGLDNTDLGVSYLLNELTEEKWKSTLKARIKKEEKNNNIYHILYMFVHVLNDLFRNVIEDKNIHNFYNNSDKLVEYTNEQLQKINKSYKIKETKYLIKL